MLQGSRGAPRKSPGCRARGRRLGARRRGANLHGGRNRSGLGGKPASVPQSGEMAAISFDRDPVQLSAGAFDVWSLSFSDHDQFLAAGGGGGWDNQNPGQWRIWDFGKAREIASYPTLRGVQSVALSPDGRRLAFCTFGGDISWREVGGAELLKDNLDGYPNIVFSPDGKLLVAARKPGQLQVWDGLTGKPFDEGKGAFHGAMFPFYWVGFSPDGKYLVATGGKKNEPGDIKFAVWSVASRQQLYKKSVDVDRIFGALISPDSQTLATKR